MCSVMCMCAAAFWICANLRPSLVAVKLGYVYFALFMIMKLENLLCVLYIRLTSFLTGVVLIIKFRQWRVELSRFYYFLHPS